MDRRAALRKEIDRTRAVVVSSAQNALWFLEARDLDSAEQILREALEAHSVAQRAYLNSLKPERKDPHVNRSAA